MLTENLGKRTEQQGLPLKPAIVIQSAGKRVSLKTAVAV